MKLKAAVGLDSGDRALLVCSMKLYINYNLQQLITVTLIVTLLGLLHIRCPTPLLGPPASTPTWNTEKRSTPVKVRWMGEAVPGRVVYSRRQRPPRRGEAVGSCDQPESTQPEVKVWLAVLLWILPQNGEML